MSTPEPRPIRIGNSEREAAVRELGEYYAQGRLDAREYEERTAAAYAARTADHLTPLFEDLPRQHEASTVALPANAAAARSPGQDLAAPFGRDPVTGAPYSDRYKLVAGLLQLFLPFGIGRFYTGHTGMAVAQLLVALTGIGVLWSFIDGILLLAGRPVDSDGLPLRP